MKNKTRISPLALAMVLMLTNSCKKDETTTALTDADGNVYSTVTIGTQIWMKENLKTTKYRDGTSITNITDDSTWGTQTTGAYCWYNNDIANKPTYGALYNWYTMVDSRSLCPRGWHVPTDAEWSTLTTYLGGESVAGDKLKATTLWHSFNTGAYNSSKFTALPGGYRIGGNGLYSSIGNYGFFWSVTEIDALTAWSCLLDSRDSGFYRLVNGMSYGFSVRCLRD